MDPALEQQRTRAVGRFIRNGPGYDNRVIETVVYDTVFSTPVEAQRYIDSYRPKYATQERLSNSRRLKHMDGSSD